MKGKAIEFRKPGSKPNPTQADQFVGKGQGASSEKMKRLTIDVPESLHRRIKAQCATRGFQMADIIRGLLDEEFPEGR